MKSNFTLVLTLLSFFGFAQESLKLPNFIPPSPQAYELTKYGDVPVDESSGRISLSIPVHTYTAGSLQVPISFSTSGGGVKVSQTPTWTGVGWNLNAGGVITRTVKDLPDETALDRGSYSYKELLDMRILTVAGIYELPGNVVAFLRNNKFNDTEADVFNFSFPGYSGSFYLVEDENGIFHAKLTKYESELKIDILGDFSAPSGFVNFEPNLNPNYSFRITTTDGTKYYFGGLVIGTEVSDNKYACEETQLMDQNNPLKISLRVKTAFYLNMIESFHGDKIYFTYHTKDKYDVFYAREQSISVAIGGGPGNQCVNATPVSEDNDLSTIQLIKNTVYNGKFLKKIYSPQSTSQVVFNSFEVIETIGHNHQENLKYRVLTDIDLGLKKVDLQYFPTEQTLASTSLNDKFFLTNVVIKDADNIKSETYALEYEDLLHVPSLYSNSQDYLGYYNGINNPSLIPKSSSKMLVPFFKTIGLNMDSDFVSRMIGHSDFNQNQSSLGNREPFFVNAKKGILKKITYPTGGYTTFEYEPVDKKRLYENKTFQIQNYGPGSTAILEDVESISAYELDGLGNTIPSNIPSQSIIVKLIIGASYPYNHADYHDYIYMQITDLTDSNVPVVYKRVSLSAGDIYSSTEPAGATLSFVFEFETNHSYSFKLGFGDNSAGHITSSNIQFLSYLGGSASFSYISGLDPNDGLGIRIKRVKDYSSTTDIPMIKRYYYSTIKEINSESPTSKIKVYEPLFQSFFATQHICTEPIDVNDEEFSYLIYHLELHSNSLTQNLPSTDSSALYKNVTISSGGDEFENGGVEKTFHIVKDKDQKHFAPNPDNFATIFDLLQFKFMEFNPANKTNNGVVNGLVTKETFFGNGNEGIYKLKENIYDYDLYRNDSISNLSIKTLYPCTDCHGNIIPNLFVGTSKTYSLKPFLIKKTEREFVEKKAFNAYSIYMQTYYYQGWPGGDLDNDGINNSQEPTDYPVFLTEQEFEDRIKRITTITEYDYSSAKLAGLPHIVTTTMSDGEVSKIKNYYPTIFYTNQLIDLSPFDPFYYDKLQEGNRIGTPIQVESFKSSIKLGTERTLYKLFNNDPLKIYVNKIQSAKDNDNLEDRIIYHEYDDKGNPLEISLANGTKVVYIWSPKRKPLYKVVNATYAQVVLALGGSGVIDDNLLPNAQITKYIYHPTLDLVTKITEPNGTITNYFYDEFGRLEFIKDKDWNILQEFDNHYKPQN
ncbi:MAG: hypothetical protein ABWY22_01080 [Flavobacterium sp.]